MYVSSAAPILPGDRERAAQHLAWSEARRNDAAQASINGRLALWRTITSPADLAQMFGAQLGANAKMMQDETAVSRATALAGSADAAPLSSVHDVIAPRSYSLNGAPSQVDGCTWAPSPQILLPPSPIPTMPLRAPDVYQTSIGPASMPALQSPQPTSGGLTGYAPPWSDALVTDSQSQMDNPDMGVGAWIADHPWLCLAIAVGGVVVLSRSQR